MQPLSDAFCNSFCVYARLCTSPPSCVAIDCFLSFFLSFFWEGSLFHFFFLPKTNSKSCCFVLRLAAVTPSRLLALLGHLLRTSSLLVAACLPCHSFALASRVLLSPFLGVRAPLVSCFLLVSCSFLACCCCCCQCDVFVAAAAVVCLLPSPLPWLVCFYSFGSLVHVGSLAVLLLRRLSLSFSFFSFLLSFITTRLRSPLLHASTGSLSR